MNLNVWVKVNVVGHGVRTMMVPITCTTSTSERMWSMSAEITGKEGPRNSMTKGIIANSLMILRKAYDKHTSQLSSSIAIVQGIDLLNAGTITKDTPLTKLQIERLPNLRQHALNDVARDIAVLEVIDCHGGILNRCLNDQEYLKSCTDEMFREMIIGSSVYTNDSSFLKL